MPRKLFIEHLKAATAAGKVCNISGVRAGDDDGMLEFCYSGRSIENLKVTAGPHDVADYPDTGYFLFTDSDENCPPAVSTALETLQESLFGVDIPGLLAKVSAAIDKAIATHEKLSYAGTDDDDDLMEGEDDDRMEEDDEDSQEDFDYGDPITQPSSAPRLAMRNSTTAMADYKAAPELWSRLRSDLRKAKDADLKVGILGDPMQNGFVCVSCRVVKLGISEEAMRAWGLRRQHYLVLLIQYVRGYKTLVQISEDSKAVGMRVALCRRYKPSLDEARNVFSKITTNQNELAQKVSRGQGSVGGKDHLEGLFIGTPLNELLNDRLANIIMWRLSNAFSWDGAEKYEYNTQGCARGMIDPNDIKYNMEDKHSHAALPPMVTADHIGELTHYDGMSFPLAAMQFLFRHFVRCTEFCLVCHCKVEAKFEALKPYVCSRPLCLYQYMALGFGPRIEWEILSQPAVVDLLVSFCYSSASQARLNEFPEGIYLQVPPAELFHGIYPVTDNEKSSLLNSSYKVKFNRYNMEILFPDRNAKNPLTVGDWVIVHSGPVERPVHARVQETCYWPKVSLGPAVVPSRIDTNQNQYQGQGRPQQRRDAAPTPAPTPPPNLDLESIVSKYSENFDDLNIVDKRSAIIMLLNTLPDVRSMKNFLETRPRGQDPSLSKWRERISQSALNVLRWIVASNRSCIIQVDQMNEFESPPEPGAATLTLQGTSQNPITLDDDVSSSDDLIAEERVSGMNGWLQFRFAQGAPDKEQRFVDSVEDARKRLNLQYPTLFAWHGSPLQNWHSIIREGLHFKDTAHGRAYGHGVYMANNSSVSLGYSGHHGYGNYGGPSSWPQSHLKVTTALSLQEVVNAPKEFVSRNPYYVVSQLDWIQTRYLFVQSGGGNEDTKNTGPEKAPSLVFAQDPQAPVTGSDNKQLQIPITAVSKSRRPMQSTQPQRKGSKKIKVVTLTNQQAVENALDDAASDATDTEDLALVSSGDAHSKPSASSKTDFVPGCLDYATLPLIQPPSDASMFATKAIQHCFKLALESQKKTPLHQLGWYIDAEKTDNMYQWIVELHTFDPSLPLAIDMKKAGIKSVVLEIRFTPNFPYSPPFVRVIRPRFLPFHRGGGGHVTGGGAICMDFLTASGWSSVSDIESVLLNVKMAMSSTDPHPARLESTAGAAQQRNDYSVGEAVQAYRTACQVHGWKVPEDFAAIERGEGSSMR